MVAIFVLLAILALAAPSALSTPSAVASNGGQLKIVNGDIALRGQFPYQVSVRRLAWLSWRHRCGGSLIDSEWVLTTASCTKGAWTLRVAAGKADLTVTEEGEQVVKVSKTIVHPNFNAQGASSRPWEFDVALLRTASPITFSQFARPARLPISDQGESGGTFLVTGWGVTTPGWWFGWGRRSADKLQVTVVQAAPCPVSDAGQQAGHSLCVSQESTATPCEGDEGGALVQMLKDNTFTIVAMVTRTPADCLKPREPSAAVSVFGMNNFIQDTMSLY